MAEFLQSEMSNTLNLTGFKNYVSETRQAMKRQYDRSVNKDLSQQKWQDLFKRNVTAVLKQIYRDSLVKLQYVSLDSKQQQQEENGYSVFCVQALKAYEGLIDELLQYALQKHRTSCALSNFPDEHNPSEDYLAEVIQEANKDWQAFAVQVNDQVNKQLSG